MARKQYSKSDLEQTFETYWEMFGGELELVCQYKFHPDYRYRADYAHVDSKTLIEIQGGLWGNGGHNRPLAYMKDCERATHAMERGYIIIPITRHSLGLDALNKKYKNPETTMQQIIGIIQNRMKIVNTANRLQAKMNVMLSRFDDLQSVVTMLEETQ